MAFPRPWWPKQERVLALRDEAPRGELVDQRAVHLLIEIKVKGVECGVRVAKACLFVSAFEQSVLPAQEFVRHERRHEIDRRELLGLGVAQAGFEDGRHAGQAEFAERVIELDEIHSGSPVLRSMRSR